MKYKKRVFLGVIALGFGLATNASAYETRDVVKWVIDGDTVQFKTMDCRLAYVDTPESGNNPKAKRDISKFNLSPDVVYDAGRYAKRYAKSYIRKGHTYTIQVHKKGVYGRSICEIFLPNGKSFNEQLISDGFAVPFYRYIPRKKKRFYFKLSKSAIKNNKGLWRISPVLMHKMLKEKE